MADERQEPEDAEEQPEEQPEEEPTLIGRMRQRYVWMGAGAMIVVVLGLAFYALLRYDAIQTQTEEVAAQQVTETRAQFEAVRPLATAELGALRTYRNEEHVERAEALGISDLADRREVAALVKQEALVPLESNAYYFVREMNYSVPFVTEDLANLLLLIGLRFQAALREAGLPPYRFVITSATRTRQDQRALQGVNINAAEKSSHEFGTTVDLHYQAFDYAAEADSLPEAKGISPVYFQELLARAYSDLTAEQQQALKAILGRVLRELQREGKVLVIYERRQPVYHITVGRSIPAPSEDSLRLRKPTPDDPVGPLVAVP